MRKIIYKSLIILFALLVITNTLNITENISKAADYSFNLSGSSSANVGDTITFTITANGLTGNVKLSGSNVSLSDSQKWVEKNTVTFTAKVNAFPASVTATPVELTDNEYNIVTIAPVTRTISEIKVEVPEVKPQPEEDKGSSQTKPQEQTSPPSSSEKQTGLNQTQNQGRPNNQQNGNSNLNEQEHVKSSNNYLKNLQVSIGTLSPEFYRETYEYKIDNIIEDEIEVLAEAEDEKAVVNGAGTIALQSEENRINIEVIAENEQARTYTIIVNKNQKIEESDLRLETLEIQTINEENKFENLDIGFNKENLNYRVTVEDNVTDLNVLATVGKEGIIIKTEGDKNLKEGENIVTITLTNQEDENSENNETNIENSINEETTYQTVYTIKVTRKAKPIVEISNKADGNINKIIAAIVLTLIIIILITIAIITHKNKSKNKKYKRKK